MGARNDKGIMGLIFYERTFVGGVVNCIDDKYGARTSLLLTSQRMPSRYNAYIDT